MKSFLKLEVGWKDNDMFELETTASNGRFSGTTMVYERGDTLQECVDSLVGFPLKMNSSHFYEVGTKDSYAYFSMRFYTIDDVGHLGVQVILESNVPTNHRAEEKDRLTLEILTEPALLDTFLRGLSTLAKNQEGQAILEGVN